MPPELLKHPEEPPCLAHVWSWFCEMTTPLTWIEIEAWSRIAGIVPERWEGVLLLRLDILRREIINGIA